MLTVLKSNRDGRESSAESGVAELFLEGETIRPATEPIAGSVKIALAALQDVKREVLHRRYGIGEFSPQTYEEIAAALTASLDPKVRVLLADEYDVGTKGNLTVSTIESIEDDALRSLRKKMKN